MKFCGSCGKELADDEMFCPSCGAQCGEAAQQQEPAQSENIEVTQTSTEEYQTPAEASEAAVADVEEIKKNYDSELSAVQVVNGIREKLIEDGVIQCEQCPLLSEWDENKVINQLIKDYRLILNRDYELNRVRQQLAPELIAQIAI